MPRATHPITGFQREADARRFLDDLRERLAAFALELHPEKTRLIPFGRYAQADRMDAERSARETFDFLGFTHIGAKSNGDKFLLKRQTMRKRMRAKLAEIKEEMRYRLHQRIAEQGKRLRSVVAGYFAYHAVPTNTRSISAFRYHVIQMWLRSLRRRSQRHNMLWDRMNRIIDAWIPQAAISHPWPNQRFDVKHPRQEPSALAAHARICAGARREPCPNRDCCYMMGRFTVRHMTLEPMTPLACPPWPTDIPGQTAGECNDAARSHATVRGTIERNANLGLAYPFQQPQGRTQYAQKGKRQISDKLFRIGMQRIDPKVGQKGKLDVFESEKKQQPP
jgi:hypothetical protein